MEAVRQQARNRRPPQRVLVVTTDAIPGYQVTRVFGLVTSTRSHTQWKSLTQKGRLGVALEGALAEIKADAAAMGANAIVGARATPNSSEGGSAAFGGSSDAVLIIGTAVLATPRSELFKACPACCGEVPHQATRCQFCAADV
jgi:uncharacterized protein YbjQ (UPF0145 family)